MSDRNNNYYFKFRYQDWLLLTQLLKPLPRDILFTVMCRRAVCHKAGIEVDQLELEGLWKQFYRGKRKPEFFKHIEDLAEKRLIIKSKDQHKGTYGYTTVMNEQIELELARNVELTARREQKKAMRELGESKKRNEPILLSKELRDEFESYKDINRD